MPVLADPPAPSVSSWGGGFRPEYFFLSLALFLFVSIFLRRKHSPPNIPMSPSPEPSPSFLGEKNSLLTEEPASTTTPPPPTISESHFASPHHLSKPLKLPFPSQISSNPASESNAFSPTMMDLPRRRSSYTKTAVVAGGEEIPVNGEIIVAEGWRRHTMVFGGGVCKACEESERRMTA